jgi:hypothetical protein
MRRCDHDVIRHAVEFGIRNRHPAVMRLRQHCPGHWIDRAVSGDDADGIIDRWEHRMVHRASLRAELLSGRSEKGAVGAKILQAVGDFAAAVRRAEHDDAAQALWPIAGEIDPRQQPAHGMTDEMDRASQAAGKQFDGGMDVLRQRFQRLSPACIVQIERGEAGDFQRRLHLAERSRRPADAVQQDDAVWRCVGRCGPAAHLYSRSCHHGK